MLSVQPRLQALSALPPPPPRPTPSLCVRVRVGLCVRAMYVGVLERWYGVRVSEDATSAGLAAHPRVQAFR